MLHAIANAPAVPRGLRHFMASIEPRRAEIIRTETGARIVFSDGRIVMLDKESHLTENTFMTALQQWAQRHGASSITVEYR